MNFNLMMRKRTPAQIKIHQSKSRFNIACWGRQSGKTTTGLDKMVYKPLQGRPGGVYWYILQTHTAAEVAFNRYWDLLHPTQLLMKEKPNESEKFVHLVNGAKVFFKSGQNFEDLRVETLDGVVIDEYRQQDPALWSRVIRPMLAFRSGWADVYSTPNGYDHFYDLFEAAKTDSEWGCFHAPSTDAWWWTPEEVASAKATMSDDEYAQEIMAEFRELGMGKVYKNHGIWNQVPTNPFAITGQLWSPHLPIVVGLDFNVGLMCWELGQFRGRDSWFGDELAVPDTNTQECAQILLPKVRSHPSGVVLIGDASGKSRKTSASATDYQIIMQVLTAGGVKLLKNKTPEANGGVHDRVNICNAALKDANGEVHARYSPEKCPRLKRDLERVLWRQGTGNTDLDKRDPLLTHPSDAWGYSQVLHSDAWKPKVGKLRVISR